MHACMHDTHAPTLGSQPSLSQQVLHTNFTLHATALCFMAAKGWPSMGSSAQGMPNGTPSPAMYGASPGGQQAGYGTGGQDLFGQSTNYASPGAYGAFAPQQPGYGGSQVQPTQVLLRLYG